MATPHISGLAALLLDAFPMAAAAQLEAAILSSCARPTTMHLDRANRGVPDGVLALEELARLLGLQPPAVVAGGGSPPPPPKQPKPSKRKRSKS